MRHLQPFSRRPDILRGLFWLLAVVALIAGIGLIQNRLIAFILMLLMIFVALPRLLASAIMDSALHRANNRVP